MNPATNTKYKILFIMFSFALLLTGFIIFIQITHFTEHTRRMLIEKTQDIESYYNHELEELNSIYFTRLKICLSSEDVLQAIEKKGQD